jgi:hypothetical protein
MNGYVPVGSVRGRRIHDHQRNTGQGQQQDSPPESTHFLAFNI